MIMLKTIANMKNVVILNKDAQSKIGGGGTCGINYYDTHGNLMDAARGMSKSDAQSGANSWNTTHQSTCGPNCGAVAKWCCASCVQI
jgi:hypothetical protein